MKLYNPLIGYIFAIWFALACNKNQTTTNYSTEIININPYSAEESISLSEIADSIKCVKLKLDTGIIGRVREIQIREKYIYVMDISQQIIFVFDKEGNFVSILDKRGEGPDEYLHIGPFFVDKDEQYVEVINLAGNKTSKLKYANISFELLEKLTFPDFNYSACRMNNGFYYFATQQAKNSVNKKQTNSALLISDSLYNTTTLFNKNIKTNHTYFSPNTECFTLNDSNELFVSIMYDNTFYKLDTQDAIPVFTVDFGKYGINNKIGSESTQKQTDYLQSVKELAAFPVLNINNKDIMSFSYYFKQDNSRMLRGDLDLRFYIKIKKNNKVYHTKTIINDITSFPNHINICSYFGSCNHEVWFNDYLVDVVIPSLYFKGNMDEKIFFDGIGEVSADDDPIIVFIKLKK
jgi:hypothetical protein